MKTTYIVKNNFAPTDDKKKQEKKKQAETNEKLSQKVLELKEAYLKALGE